MIRFDDSNDNTRRPDDEFWPGEHEEDDERSEEYSIAPGKRTLTQDLDPRTAELRPRRNIHRDASQRGKAQPLAVPGKRTHTARLEAMTRNFGRRRDHIARRQAGAAGSVPHAPVQRRARGEVEDEVINRAARAGLQGSGQSLPYFDRIQAGVGRFDISFIRAHLGDDVAAACTAMQAEAFAAGSRVAFRDRPDLFTVAHEVTHVLQQVGGYVPSGGVGRSGDRYERHADEVAHRVIAGQSAESLIAQMDTAGRLPVLSSQHPAQSWFTRTRQGPIRSWNGCSLVAAFPAAAGTAARRSARRAPRPMRWIGLQASAHRSRSAKKLPVGRRLAPV
ncbi:MAG: DUF4157 domain-containing protein [Proteobacteria bacterium]|nr:DUF4157 domain-containing protein [Pseudomonadota bacterium]